VDESGFRGFIKEGVGVAKNLDERTIRAHIETVKEFEGFLRKRNRGERFADANGQDIEAFVAHLSEEGRVDRNSLLGLLRYSRFCRNDDVSLTLLLILSSDLLPAMCQSFGIWFGQDMHQKVLGGFEPPKLGTPPTQLPMATSDFLARIESGVGENAAREFLRENCPDTGPPEYYSDERELFLASKDIDDYLSRHRQKFVEELEGHMVNGTLFYNQKIDADVIAFVKENLEIEGGTRRGNVIIHSKIPYMAIEYLREKDPKMKRYYYCHCPLARESILSGEKISRSLCFCSAGYCKRPLEVAFARPLKADVMKSVLWGDLVCQFSIEIPEELMPDR
jgi:hypothetical protein